MYLFIYLFLISAFRNTSHCLQFLSLADDRLDIDPPLPPPYVRSSTPILPCPSLPVSVAVSHFGLLICVPTSVTPALPQATSDGPPAQRTLEWLRKHQPDMRGVLFVFCLFREDVKSSPWLQGICHPLNKQQSVKNEWSTS